jgi:hypothetical protein
MPERLYSTTEVARVLHVSDGRVRQLAASRGTGQRVGRSLVFTSADLGAMLDRINGRPRMDGSRYPLMADVARLMAEEGIDQETAIRRFGLEP